MTYTVHYWRTNLVNTTGLEQGSEITAEQLAKVIAEAQVNVMIHHVAENLKLNRPAVSYCYIDDLNHRFQPR